MLTDVFFQFSAKIRLISGGEREREVMNRKRDLEGEVERKKERERQSTE